MLNILVGHGYQEYTAITVPPAIIRPTMGKLSISARAILIGLPAGAAESIHGAVALARTTREVSNSYTILHRDVHRPLPGNQPIYATGTPCLAN